MGSSRYVIIVKQLFLRNISFPLKDNNLLIVCLRALSSSFTSSSEQHVLRASAEKEYEAASGVTRGDYLFTDKCYVTEKQN